MRVIKPIKITTEKLLYSSIGEPDSYTSEVVWDSEGTYAEGDEVIRTTTHLRYRHKAVGGDPHSHELPPELDPTHWEVLRPTNRWAVFDESVGTASIAEGDGSTEIVYEFTLYAAANAVALFELSAQEVQVQVYESPEGALVYDNTISLDETELADWYAYFFEPFTVRSTAIDLSLPPYANGIIRISIRGPSVVSVGNIVLGNAYTLGVTGYGATAGIRDYSRKVQDETTGVITLERRKFAKIMRARFRLNEAAVNFTHQLLSDLRSTPAVWLGDNGAGLEPLIVYGFYRDFSLELETAKISYYSLEVEGMV